MKKAVMLIATFIIISALAGCASKEIKVSKSTHDMNNKAEWKLSDGKILRTTDSGRSWINVSPPEQALAKADNDEMQEHRAGAFFLNDKTAWVALDTNDNPNGAPVVKIYRTIDAGKSWSSAVLPTKYLWEGYYVKTDFINSETGWILLESSVALNQQTHKTLYTTKDGGKTWTKISDIGTVINHTAAGMVFKNSNQGWITSCLGQGCIPLFETDDGGNTWYMKALEVPEEYRTGYNISAYSPIFNNADNLNGTLQVEFQDGYNINAPIIVNYKTDDGVTWNAAGFPERTVSFVLNSKIYIISDDYSSLKDVTPRDIKKNISFSDVHFFNGSNGLATLSDADGHSSIYETEDGGKTWSKHDINRYGYLGNISYIDKNNSWVLLHEDAAMMHEKVAVLQTKDGGTTWNIISEVDPLKSDKGGIPFVGDKSGISFQDDKIGWITGYEPMDDLLYLISTKDSGLTWEMKNLYVAKEFKGSQTSTFPPVFFSSKDGILPARIFNEKQSYAFYETHDGGETWTYGSAIKDLKNNNYNLVWSFYGGESGYATDGHNLYFLQARSSEWKIIKSNMNYSDVQKIIFISDKLGWIIDKTGVYKTTDGGINWESEELSN